MSSPRLGRIFTLQWVQINDASSKKRRLCARFRANPSTFAPGDPKRGRKPSTGCRGYLGIGGSDRLYGTCAPRFWRTQGSSNQRFRGGTRRAARSLGISVSKGQISAATPGVSLRDIAALLEKIT